MVSRASDDSDVTMPSCELRPYFGDVRAREDDAGRFHIGLMRQRSAQRADQFALEFG